MGDEERYYAKASDFNIQLYYYIGFFISDNRQETVHKNVSGLYSLSPYIQSVRNLYESTYAIKRT